MNWKPADIAMVKALAGEGGGGGVTPNIQATAETLPAGSEATVTRTGSDANPVFNFGIPKGDPGNPGNDATINGKNAITLVPGENVSITTGEDGTVNISSTGGDAGVSSFNGRAGAVTPQAGDYTAAMVGAIPAADADTFAKKSDLTSVYKYKGSVATVAELPAADNTVGDVWNVETTDMNYGWTGTAWDPLGQMFSVDSITNAEIDTILSA